MAKNTVGAMIAAISVLVALGIGILEATGILDISQYGAWVTIFLVVAGLILGVVNISTKESVPFMVATLVVAGGATALAVLPMVGEWVQIIFARIATLVVPAAIVVALGVAFRNIKN